MAQQPDGLTDWDMAAEASGKPAPEPGAWGKAAFKDLRLGMVVGGSLSEGLRVRLDRKVIIEQIKVGTYVSIEARGQRFFAMITDISLDATNPAMERTPPDVSDDFLREVHMGTSAYGRLDITPLLVLLDDENEPRPVKSIPAHYAAVGSASPEEVNRVFGESDERHLRIGHPIEMEDAAVNLDLDRLVERSTGIFGKSGTGKSFLTRILLSGIIKSNAAVNLIFDMHNDYGWQVPDEQTNRPVKGLYQLHESRMAIYTLDPDSSLRRKSPRTGDVIIGYDDIEPEDLEMLQQTLNLSDQMLGAAYTLRRQWGKRWVSRFLNDDASPAQDGSSNGHGSDGMGSSLEELTERQLVTEGTLGALRRRLERLTRHAFLQPGTGLSSVDRIFDSLNNHRSVVLEFGRYGNSLDAYIFVANFLTRRLHQKYVERVEEALGDRAQEPPHLVITIEEAHKFLDPAIARQTIFGTIARELRKYNVTLLIVDQRPSGIDPEVMSQIGTRITCLLDNEEDIRAVFTGISGASELRQVLARLDSKEQALIMGYAVPMPVVVQTRKYDETFYAEQGYVEGDDLTKKADDLRKRLSRGKDEGAF